MTEFECTGSGADHCCYIMGEPCMFLGENVVPGRRWACTLLVELGSWDAVLEDERYQQFVQPVWDALDARDESDNIISCRDWFPEPGVCCRGDK